MRVILFDEVFGSPTDQLEILNILAFGYQDRHQILTNPLVDLNSEDPVTNNFTNWLSSLPGSLREDILFALELGQEALVEGKPKEEIEVTSREESDWNASPPQLTVQDARRLLDRSLHLLVENARNDRQFLKTIFKRLLGADYWRPLRKAIDEKWIHYEHGGGLGSMKNAIAENADDPVDRLRTWVMFDSDAPKLGAPSRQSEALRKLCEDKNIDHHQLQRRAIENYLPIGALRASTSSISGPAKTKRRQKVEAFDNLSRDQQHHFNLKRGFRKKRQGDEEPGEVENPPEFFEDVSLDDRQILAGGFGGNIADLFYESNTPGWSDWLQNGINDVEKSEFFEIYDEIYQKL